MHILTLPVYLICAVDVLLLGMRTTSSSQCSLFQLSNVPSTSLLLTKLSSSQVVSPEFTFYDSSKSFLDDSSHGEKLLRAKTDISFM